jgi:hypothetical protein
MPFTEADEDEPIAVSRPGPPVRPTTTRRPGGGLTSDEALLRESVPEHRPEYC